MSKDLQHLHTLHSSSALSGPSRILFTAVAAVIIGVIASPVAEPWLLIVFTVLFAVIAIAITVRHHRSGLRSNNHAPMRPDSETPRSLGGTKAPDTPETPDEKRQRYLTYTGPAVYIMVMIGGWIPATVVGWIWAGAVTAVVFGLSWRYFHLTDANPVGYVPLETVFAAEPDWTPTNGTDAVATTLYALQAVPHGRQVRMDALQDAAGPLGVDRTELHTAVDALSARGQAVALRERKSDNTIVNWVALTENGRDAVCTGCTGDAAA
ncbi:MAG TPA: hypothetical protein H9870_12235 [Candidatus Corynebacterium avicola]|uniref:Uncharacterized protein n=1 Tax=Candidatus Corynebacterium avicola TaxID=2838527 RepID=A0A9D1ULR1_9CORY|nr:hypothetical protein [Candidatus Corynebacterium avicola]